MGAAPKVSLVLACYNEEQILETSFAEIRQTLQELGRPFEVIFVDDLSRDRTREILRLDRYLMSRGYSFLVRRLLGVNLQDTETGFKFFRREKLLPILEQIRDPGWFWDTEFMVRALRKGLRIVEIPGAYLRRYDKTSTVRGLRDSAEYFLKLLSFRRELEREHP